MIFFQVEERAGRFYARGYRGRDPQKPFAFYSFKSAEARERWIESEEKQYAEREARRALVKNAKKQARVELVNPFQVGDLLHYSWGYEQTNCEFYQVVEVGAKSVTIRAIAGHAVPRSGGFMSERQGPCPDAFLENSKPIRKVLQVNVDSNGKAGEPYIPMDYGWASKCQPEQTFYSSWYA